MTARDAIRILLVEDDAPLRGRLAAELRRLGWEVSEAGDAAECRYALKVARVSLVVLDVGLPDGNGFELLGEIRDAGIGVPVVMLTSFCASADCVRGLNAGADDYVAKPADSSVLAARIKAVLRRSAFPAAPEEYAPLGEEARLDLAAREIACSFGRVSLSAREFLFLRYLSENRSRVVSEGELIVRVWGLDALSADTGCIRSLVSRLRRKTRGEVEIRNVYGHGYRLGGFV